MPITHISLSCIKFMWNICWFAIAISFFCGQTKIIWLCSFLSSRSPYERLLIRFRQKDSPGSPFFNAHSTTHRISFFAMLFDINKFGRNIYLLLLLPRSIWTSANGTWAASLVSSQVPRGPSWQIVILYTSYLNMYRPFSRTPTYTYYDLLHIILLTEIYASPPNVLS